MWEQAAITIGSFSLGEYASILLLVILLIAGTVLIAFFCYYIAKILTLTIEKIFRLDRTKDSTISSLYNHHVIQRIVYLIPAILLYYYHGVFDIEYKDYRFFVGAIVEVISSIYIIFALAMIVSAILNFIQDRYSHHAISRLKPIKSYLQVIKMIIFSIAFIFALAMLVGESPMYFITGLGALMAIILLVFRDSILGLVSSIQLSAYDMVHIGDTIEMPSFGADGKVIDISLNTVKVQNSDKSIVTIPSYALLTAGMKNWRGMEEAGGRRIKREINIDITSIKICDQELLDRLKRIDVLKDSLPETAMKFEDYAAAIDMENIRHFTNLGLFVFYLENFLRHHPGVRKDMKLLVRQMQATPTGLPLQLYVFSKETEMGKYEVIQASIMEHIYAVLPVFDLRLFQYPSDHGIAHYNSQRYIHHENDVKK